MKYNTDNIDLPKCERCGNAVMIDRNDCGWKRIVCPECGWYKRFITENFEDYLHCVEGEDDR